MFSWFKQSSPSGASSGPAFPPLARLRDPLLQRLAGACAQGDAGAMLTLSDYLRDSEQRSVVSPEYLRKGADMWLIRSALYGSAPAQERLLQKIRQQPAFPPTISAAALRRATTP